MTHQMTGEIDSLIASSRVTEKIFAVLVDCYHHIVLTQSFNVVCFYSLFITGNAWLASGNDYVIVWTTLNWVNRNRRSHSEKNHTNAKSTQCIQLHSSNVCPFWAIVSRAAFSRPSFSASAECTTNVSMWAMKRKSWSIGSFEAISEECHTLLRRQILNPLHRSIEYRLFSNVAVERVYVRV